MNNRSQNSSKPVWPNRKPGSKLSSSMGNMDSQRKELIRQVLDYDIIDIRSYRGYKGDLLIEFSTTSHESIHAIETIAESMDFEVIIQELSAGIFRIYCASAAEESFQLKTAR